MNYRRILSQGALVTGVLLFSAGLQTFAAWSAPTVAPPGADAYAPLTTSLDGQIKTGNLQVNALGIQGTGSALLVPNGNVGVGTNNPTQMLDVAGYVKGTGLCIGSDCKTAWPVAGAASPETDPTVQSWAKTSNPTIPGNLQVNGNIRAGQGPIIYVCPEVGDTGCSSDCNGFSLSSTCTYRGEQGGNYGYCWLSTQASCTPIGRMLSL